MDYYFYNIDANSLSRDHRFPILIKQGIAATSGPIRFGKELGRLSPGDTLLMYENRLGVVAVGTVLEQWDGKTHTPPLYYLPGDDGFDHEFGKPDQREGTQTPRLGAAQGHLPSRKMAN